MSKVPLSLAVPLLVAGVLAGCSDTAAPADHTALAITAQTAISQSAVVNRTAATTPVVLVADGSGRGVSGIVVHFDVTGGGSIGATDVTTDESGKASAGSWTLGTKAGVNQVVATATGLAAVTFSATGTADAFTQLLKLDGDGRFGAIGLPLTPTPSVRAADAYGNGVADIAVTFSALQGVVTDSIVATNSEGIARPGGWKLGVLGENRLSARSGGVTVEFVASVIDPCSTTHAMGVGGSVSGTLDANDCQINGRARETLSFQVAQQQQCVNIRTGGTATAFLWDVSGSTGVVAQGQAEPVASRDVILNLSAGTYLINVTAPASAAAQYSVILSALDPSACSIPQTLRSGK